MAPKRKRATLSGATARNTRPRRVGQTQNTTASPSDGQQSADSASACSFLSLPPELRNQIYDLVIPHVDTVAVFHVGKSAGRAQYQYKVVAAGIGGFNANRQIHDEFHSRLGAGIFTTKNVVARCYDFKFGFLQGYLNAMQEDIPNALASFDFDQAEDSVEGARRLILDVGVHDKWYTDPETKQLLSWFKYVDAHFLPEQRPEGHRPMFWSFDFSSVVTKDKKLAKDCMQTICFDQDLPVWRDISDAFALWDRSGGGSSSRKMRIFEEMAAAQQYQIDMGMTADIDMEFFRARLEMDARLAAETGFWQN